MSKLHGVHAQMMVFKHTKKRNQIKNKLLLHAVNITDFRILIYFLYLLSCEIHIMCTVGKMVSNG